MDSQSGRIEDMEKAHQLSSCFSRLRTLIACKSVE
jgi:hypothetical protein